MPVVIPPNMPPWRFDRVWMWGSFTPSDGSAVNRSLCSLPRIVTQPNPMPYSTPSTAGSENRAFAKSALSLSNTGSPRPAGTPVATISAAPPMESPALRQSSMSSIIRSAAEASGQRTMFGVPSGRCST